MTKVMHYILLAGVALNLWIALGYLVVSRNAGAEPPLSGIALITYVLLILAPAVTFIPIARWLEAPFYDTEAMLGWATFGYVFAFITPEQPISCGAFLIFLLPLTVVIATLATLVAYSFGRRLSPKKPGRALFFQARREGYLIAISLVVLLLLHSFEVLSPFNGTLLVIIVTLAEALILARSRPTPATQA